MGGARVSETEWTGWITWDRIVAQENRLAKLGAQIATPIFECALMEPAKYSTKLHAIAGTVYRDQGRTGPLETLCGRTVPEDDPDAVAIWTHESERAWMPSPDKCKRCERKLAELADR